ncbi:MAG: Lrp/AsnC family transcriptional regulator [Nanoarchaeota archaeon]|nr:Lrp/AsnC family transcriptional regulator [Nanoarchaeota archaeon]
MENNKPNIDLKDKKILVELDWNARTSNSEIAKKIQLSKKGAEYRIKKLEKLNIIQGYYPVINFEKIGYTINRMMFKLQLIDTEIKEKIEEYLKKQENIHWAVWFRGDADLGIDVWTKSIKEFKEILNQFSIKFGKYIKQKTFSSSVGFDQYPYSFLLNKKDERIAIITEETEIAKIDGLDKKILRQLVKNARESSAEIARKINSNYKTVSNRIKQLEKNKILLCTRALINVELLGYKMYKLRLCFDNNIQQAYKQANEFFKSRLETVYIVDFLGEEDYDVEVIVKNEDEFNNLIKDLQNKLGRLIRGYTYFLFEKNIKVRYLPDI